MTKTQRSTVTLHEVLGRAFDGSRVVVGWTTKPIGESDPGAAEIAGSAVDWYLPTGYAMSGNRIIDPHGMVCEIGLAGQYRNVTVPDHRPRLISSIFANLECADTEYRTSWTARPTNPEGPDA